MGGASKPGDKEGHVKRTSAGRMIVGYGGGTTAIGPEYGFGTAMEPFVKEVLADPGKFHPDYDPKAGYEVAGCVWFQGYSDRGAPADEYKALMKTFIEDMRRLVKTPKMPFVIGVLGTGRFKESTGRTPVVQAQRATAELPEFKGNVKAVETYVYYPAIAGDGQIDETAEVNHSEPSYHSMKF